MKKIKLLTGLSTLSALGVGVATLTSCDHTQKFTIHFNTNGGSEIADIKVKKNSTITKPVDPIKKGNTFYAWYSDEELTTEFDFNTKVTSDLTLYAGWLPLETLTEEKWFEQYDIYLKKFLTLSTRYTKDDIVLKINGTEITDKEVEYLSSPLQCEIKWNEAGNQQVSTIVGGETSEQIKQTISIWPTKHYYKDDNYLYIFLTMDDREYSLLKYNKCTYKEYTFAYDTLGKTYRIDTFKYSKEPTK